MRNFVFKLITLILVVLLCINFVRFFIQSDVYEPVSVTAVLSALENIGADPEPLLDSLSLCLSDLLKITHDFTNIFFVHSGARWNILGTIIASFDNFFYFVNSMIIAIGDTLAAAWAGFEYLGRLFTSIINFLNVVLGTHYVSPNIPTSPVGNGGGGRR